MSFPIVSVAQMRALEAAAVAAGTVEVELQERAGRAVADAISGRVERGVRVGALAGAGNNGRDAVVAARYLAARGHAVAVWVWPTHALSGAELAQLRGMDVSVRRLDSHDSLAALGASLGSDAVVIDGLLGVGTRGPMRSELSVVAGVVNEVRAARPGLLVVAVDVPSGLDADSGAAPGVVVRADLTVTFGAIKAGLLRFPGAELSGHVIARPIDLPSSALGEQPVQALDAATVARLVPARPLDAHKYRFGRVLVVAGSDQYVGAACLGSSAAARSGCGLVGLVSTEAAKQVLAQMLPVATYPATLGDVERDPEGNARTVAALLPEQQALLIGPGIGRSAATDRFLRALVRVNRDAEEPATAVIDADALSLLGGWDTWWEELGAGHIVTPHAGEMARLIGEGGADPDAAPWDEARRWAARWKQVVVLKGPFTTVAAPDGRAWVWPRANPTLATGGTGDVLAGLCAGLLAQGMPAVDAARLAVVVHARAADTVIRRKGWRTLLASDLLDEIPREMALLGRKDAATALHSHHAP